MKGGWGWCWFRVSGPAATTSWKHQAPDCHLDRSVAEWRDLRFPSDSRRNSREPHSLSYWQSFGFCLVAHCFDRLQRRLGDLPLIAAQNLFRSRLGRCCAFLGLFLRRFILGCCLLVVRADQERPSSSRFLEQVR